MKTAREWYKEKYGNEPNETGEVMISTKEILDLQDEFLKAVIEGQNLPIHNVSDCKKLNIHECLNDLERIFHTRTPALVPYAKLKSVRYEFKKAIDKMICSR